MMTKTLSEYPSIQNPESGISPQVFAILPKYQLKSHIFMADIGFVLIKANGIDFADGEIFLLQAD